MEASKMTSFVFLIGLLLHNVPMQVLANDNGKSLEAQKSYYAPKPSSQKKSPPSNCGAPHKSSPTSKPPSTGTPSVPYTPTPSGGSPATGTPSVPYTPTPSGGSPATGTPSVPYTPTPSGGTPSVPYTPTPSGVSPGTATPSVPYTPAPSGVSPGIATPSVPLTPTTPMTPTFPLPPTGGSPTGTSPFGSAPAGTAPFGSSPTGTAPFGSSPTGTSPFGSSPFGLDPNTPFTCYFWSSHPGLIWSLFGWWCSLGRAFGVNSLPGVSSTTTLPQALAMASNSGYGLLYREGTASLLNAMVNPRFPFTTSQVKRNFVSALASEKTAASQGKMFKMANEGKIKARA